MFSDGMGLLVIVLSILFVWAQVKNALMQRERQAVFNFLRALGGVFHAQMTDRSTVVEQTARNELPLIIALTFVLAFLFYLLAALSP